jgi:hypothetical protein
VARYFFQAITYIASLRLVEWQMTAEPKPLVQCQLCFVQIEQTQREYHLKEVHKVSAAAIGNNRPLTHWFKPVAPAA